MATKSHEPGSAEARMKKKAQQAAEGQKAMLEYEASLKAMRDKTARLRALRLEHEEAEAKLAAEAPPKKKAAKKAVKAAKGVKSAGADNDEPAEAVADRLRHADAAAGIFDKHRPRVLRGTQP